MKSRSSSRPSATAIAPISCGRRRSFRCGRHGGEAMMAPAVLWGIFARLLAVIYVIAFLSIRAEIVEWAGARGLNPVRETLARFREALGRWRAPARYPTLLGLDDSDRALRWLPVSGAIAALFAACGVASTPMLAFAWVV